MKHISEEFRKTLRTRIGEIEGKTAVEFVPVWISQSSNYGLYRAFLMAVAFLLLSALYVWLPLGQMSAALITLGLLVGAALLVSSRDAFYYLLPGRLAHSEIETEAALQFLSNEVFATRGRTGVLLLVSELERAVFVLADKGLLKKMPGEEWRELGQALAEDFNRSEPGQSFITALDKLEERVTKEFPPGSDNPNELSDELKH